MFGKQELEFYINQINVDYNEIQKKIVNRSLNSLDITSFSNNLEKMTQLCNVANISDVKIADGIKKIYISVQGLTKFIDNNMFFPAEVARLDNILNSMKSKIYTGNAIKVTGKIGKFMSKSATNRINNNLKGFKNDINTLKPKF